MSGRKSIEVEQRLFFLTEQMAQVRHDEQTGRVDSKFARARIDSLHSEYVKLRAEGEDAAEEEEDLSTWDDLLEEVPE